MDAQSLELNSQQQKLDDQTQRLKKLYAFIKRVDLVKLPKKSISIHLDIN